MHIYGLHITVCVYRYCVFIERGGREKKQVQNVNSGGIVLDFYLFFLPLVSKLCSISTNCFEWGGGNGYVMEEKYLKFNIR